MLKRVSVILVLVLVLATSVVSADGLREGIGVGASFSAPFGFTLVGDYNFGDYSAAVSLGYRDVIQGAIEIGLEGAYHLPFTLSDETDTLVLYPSVGGRLDLQIDNVLVVGLGGVLTLKTELASVPGYLYTKAIPSLQMGTGIFMLGMHGEIGYLYYF
ncbi:MAG: hypothetical protein JXK93_11275 [Sphaerochaetaceae bacterium]|nr:hypothetical protein [Sphaerochaetaceae bacterium]